MGSPLLRERDDQALALLTRPLRQRESSSRYVRHTFEAQAAGRIRLQGKLARDAAGVNPKRGAVAASADAVPLADQNEEVAPEADVPPFHNG
ncbi:hypothetical protein [Methylosinus sp. PW1]|uniref:hypothetical protein n=1 Tax=Methylosinus sp. PW1 TaxID=107636 RepID=UPI0012EC0468|nr:hypothetical protein [Methylosinus sp. PW1]